MGLHTGVLMTGVRCRYMLWYTETVHGYVYTGILLPRTLHSRNSPLRGLVWMPGGVMQSSSESDKCMAVGIFRGVRLSLSSGEVKVNQAETFGLRVSKNKTFPTVLQDVQRGSKLMFCCDQNQGCRHVLFR